MIQLRIMSQLINIQVLESRGEGKLTINFIRILFQDLVDVLQLLFAFCLNIINQNQVQLLLKVRMYNSSPFTYTYLPRNDPRIIDYNYFPFYCQTNGFNTAEIYSHVGLPQKSLTTSNSARFCQLDHEIGEGTSQNNEKRICKIEPSPMQNIQTALIKEGQKGKRKVSTEIRQQRDSRNAHSNLLRTFFRRLGNKLEHSLDFISQIIKKQQLEITAKKFNQWYMRVNVNHKNYIRLTSVQAIFIPFSEKDEDFSKIMRIMLHDFLKNGAIQCLLTSRKAKKTAIYSNLACIRDIEKDIMVISYSRRK